MTRKTGPAGIDLIKSYESLVTKAYMPTDMDVPTIGYGHTRGVKMGDFCTVSQADAWLAEDISDAERAVNGMGVALSQSAFDALVSLVFNVGAAAVDSGTTIRRAAERRDYFGMWAGFALWKMQAGQPLRGLARRRAQEMFLFMSDPFPVP